MAPRKSKSPEKQKVAPAHHMQLRNRGQPSPSSPPSSNRTPNRTPNRTANRVTDPPVPAPRTQPSPPPVIVPSRSATPTPTPRVSVNLGQGQPLSQMSREELLRGPPETPEILARRLEVISQSRLSAYITPKQKQVYKGKGKQPVVTPHKARSSHSFDLSDFKDIKDSWKKDVKDKGKGKALQRSPSADTTYYPTDFSTHRSTASDDDMDTDMDMDDEPRTPQRPTVPVLPNAPARPRRNAAMGVAGPSTHRSVLALIPEEDESTGAAASSRFQVPLSYEDRSRSFSHFSERPLDPLDLTRRDSMDSEYEVARMLLRPTPSPSMATFSFNQAPPQAAPAAVFVEPMPSIQYQPVPPGYPQSDGLRRAPTWCP